MDLIIMGQRSKACGVSAEEWSGGAIKSQAFRHVTGSGSSAAATDIYCFSD